MRIASDGKVGIGLADSSKEIYTMKIAFIVRHYNKTGGIARYTWELAEYCVAKGHEVHVFTASWEKEVHTNIIFHKIPIVTSSFLQRKKKFAWNNILEVLSFAIFSLWHVQRNKFDIIHAQGDYPGKVDVVTAHSCHKAWLAYARQHTHSLVEKLKKSEWNPLHLIICTIEKLNYTKGRYKKIIAVSQNTLNEIYSCYHVPESESMSIPNGVDTAQFHPCNKKQWRTYIRNQYGLSEQDVVLIFVGHEFKRKGLDFVVNALAHFKNERIFLFVLGRDRIEPYYIQARKLGIGEKIIYIGFTSHTEQYYAASDIFVFPTAYEAFSLAISEAMASGLPVVTTRCAGAVEIVRNNENGFLLEIDKREENSVKALQFFIDNPEMRLQMGVRARKDIESFSWTNIAQRTEAVYKDIISEKYT